MNPLLHQSTNPLSALYGRVSTDLQSTDQQEARAKEYIAYKQFGLTAEFYDDDVSGSVPIWEREHGRELRKRLEAGDIRHLVVVKLDRLGRSAVDLLNTVEYLDTIGVILHIVDLGGDSLSTRGAAGRLMFTVLAGMAEYERELIRSRIQDKLDNKRNKNELTGTVPYGWDARETGATTAKGIKVRELVPNLVEQSWILHMVTLRAAGWGYHSIANDLNGRDVPTKRGKGEIMTLRGAGKAPADKRFTTGRWQAGNVAKVLNSKTVREWLAAKGNRNSDKNAKMKKNSVDEFRHLGYIPTSLYVESIRNKAAVRDKTKAPRCGPQSDAVAGIQRHHRR